MLSDVRLIVMKEYREVLLRMGSVRGNLLNVAFIIGVFGVFMPLQTGQLWVSAWWTPFFYAWLPFFLVSALVADSFAGERERHTLETLLTTALSDRAILLGKLAAAVIYGYGMLLVVMCVSLVTVNVRYAATAGPLFYRPPMLVGVVVFGFLGTLLIAAVGVMVSLNAKTVRQAGQALSLGILGILTVPGLVFGYGFRMLSHPAQQAVVEWAAMLDGRVVALVAAIVLAALDAAILVAAARRFRRARLVFD